jgi:hypothetical protein
MSPAEAVPPIRQSDFRLARPDQPAALHHILTTLSSSLTPKFFFSRVDGNCDWPSAADFGRFFIGLSINAQISGCPCRRPAESRVKSRAALGRFRLSPAAPTFKPILAREKPTAYPEARKLCDLVDASVSDGHIEDQKAAGGTVSEQFAKKIAQKLAKKFTKKFAKNLSCLAMRNRRPSGRASPKRPPCFVNGNWLPAKKASTKRTGPSRGRKAVHFGGRRRFLGTIISLATMVISCTFPFAPFCSQTEVMSPDEPPSRFSI